MAALRVLVTGVGGGVGQAIIKALKASKLDLEIVGADITPNAVGFHWTDAAVLLPRLEIDGKYNEIAELLRSENIDLVLIGSEHDLLFFSRHRMDLERDTGAVIVVSGPEIIDLADDKWKTVGHLKRLGLPHAQSSVPRSHEEALGDAKEFGYPLVLKSRTGSSARNVHLIKTSDELSQLFDHVPNPMLQRMIAEPSPALSYEFTSSVFVASDNTLFGPFTARRALRGGDTWIAEVGDFPNISEVVRNCVENLGIVGPFNIQLMVGSDGPVPFEFNARFSGTTAIRAHFGFNDPEFAIRSFLLRENIVQPEIKNGVAMRYLEEIYFETANEKDIESLSLLRHDACL